MKKAVLSLSGGLDSTMLLMYLLGEGYEVRAYSFKYGQKHSIELAGAAENVFTLQEEHDLPVTFQCINLEDCFSDSASSLHCKSGVEIPVGHYADENMKSTVIENRNVIFASVIYGKALSWASKTESDVEIFLGIHAGDHTIYPDCRPESREACEHAFKISNWGSERVKYSAPFVDLTKGQVLAKGIYAMYEKLDLKPSEVEHILSNTHTCYNPTPQGESCGQCGSCTERIEAFLENNRLDPITYVKEI